MTENRHLLSVGIDIGTTTTQVVFSRLKVADTSRPGQIPRISITDREIIYQSPIIFTPLLDHETVDAGKLNEIIRNIYDTANIKYSQVETGAVIITGETAKKKNADEILRALAGMAGEFVVSIAGPNVESMIAGKGSGAAQYSQSHYTSVTNLDIGGGSANSAVFRSGDFVAAAAMNFGGRILEIDHISGRITHIAAPAQAILEDIGINLRVGDTPSITDLRKFTDRMAEMAVELVEGKSSVLAAKLYLTPPSQVSAEGSILMFSGGIGYYFYDPLMIKSMMDVTVFDDVGPLLAESLRNNPIISKYKIQPPSETLRATVLGASTQSITLSGSTIWAEGEILPLRNVPVIHPKLEGDLLTPKLISAINDAVHRWDVKTDTDPFAIAIDIEQKLDYSSLMQLSTGLVEFSRSLPSERPLVIIIQSDYARAIGQTIKGLDPNRPLLVIDQVGLMEGDYIDIGTPLMDGRVVPLSIKTLVFYH